MRSTISVLNMRAPNLSAGRVKGARLIFSMPPATMIFGVTRHDGLCAAHDRPQARCADLVDGKGVRLFRHAAIDGRLPAGVLSLPRLEHVPHDHFVNGNLFQRTIEVVVLGLEVRLQLSSEDLGSELSVLCSRRPQSRPLDRFLDDQSAQLYYGHVLQALSELTNGSPRCRNNHDLSHGSLLSIMKKFTYYFYRK